MQPAQSYLRKIKRRGRWSGHVDLETIEDRASREFPLSKETIQAHEHRGDSSSLSIIGHWPVRDKFQYVAIYTIAPVLRGRAVIEYMAEVYAGACATYFHPTHAMRIISMQGHGALYRFEEAGPSCAAFEFRIAEKECRPGNRINKPAGSFFIEVGCSKGRLRALLESNFPLFRG